MDLYSYLSVLSFLLGLTLGSFMNVCIYRLPRRESIVNPPSHCPNCGARVSPLDNIPLLSYLVLRGRCRTCNNPISLRYPMVEALTGVLSLALFIRYGIHYQYIHFLFFALALVTISFIDLQHMIIPDIISLPGIAVGFAASFFAGHISWQDSLIGIVAGGGSLFLVAFCYERLTGKEGMGGGDIKLLAMIGAWMGWRPLPLVVLISALLGAVIGGVYLVASGKGTRARIPFGPFLSLGALLFLFFGRELTCWYIRLLV